jgi:NAD(P)-dependent dehydrogenase (short-subunit alcohol dehydrogenase family)
MSDGRQRRTYGDRVAIVTGGGAGLGRALCEALGAAGAVVFVADVDAEAAAVVAACIRAAGGRARDVCVEVADGAAVDAAVAQAVAEHGRLDFMFNNAGLGCWGDVRCFSDAQWQRLIDVNVWGAVHGSLAAYSVMAGQGFGHIVNTASLAGLIPVPTTIPYTAAKHAVVGLSVSLRQEAAAHGVRVTVVCPGPVRSAFHESLILARTSAGKRSYPTDALEAPAAARVILRGVAANRATIVFPLRARLTWMLYRGLPSLVLRLLRKSVGKLHGSEQSVGEQGA